MLLYSNAKINLGIRITAKRADGYHELESIMLPVGLSDLLEFAVNTETKTSFIQTGIQLNCSADDNLIIKALELVRKDFDIPQLKIHLHKCIPPGAGLGGGSSNAGFMLRGLNDYFKLGIAEENLIKYAAILGSDCAFFIRNKPCLVTGKGEKLEDLEFTGSFYLVLLFPGFPVSTKEAYESIIPGSYNSSLVSIISDSPDKWKNKLINQFEETIFYKYSELAAIKTSLYQQGAFYTSMSGSGSAIYGLFRDKPDLDEKLEGIKIWEGEMF